MENFFNWISKPVPSDEVTIWFNVHNMIYERIELYGDIFKSLDYTIRDTYMGDNIDDVKETKIIVSQEDNKKLLEEVQSALLKAKQAKQEAEKSKESALQDLDVLQKRSQTELMSTIVKVALFVILGVGILTTVMYGVALISGVDTQIIGSTWSNMFGILLTNAFSIVGTIMGVKYGTNSETTKPNQ